MDRTFRLSAQVAIAFGALSSSPVADAQSVRPNSVIMADSVMARDPDPRLIDSPQRMAWNYTQGLVLKSVLAVHDVTGDKKYLDYVNRYFDHFVNPDGTIKTYNLEEYSVDRIPPGKVLFNLYAMSKDERHRKAIELLRMQMKGHPRTKEGGFWHKKRYPWQMWLDGLYMASPFLAQYAVTFNEPALIDDVINQYVWMEKHARDSKTGLLYHGWDESREQKWANKETGLSPEFWGRAVGWYAMALVDVLDFIPKNHPRRGEIVAILGRLAEAVTKVQDPKTDVFFQVLDKGDQKGNYLESSASVMFAYSFLKGARLGALDPKYRDVGRRIYEGVNKEFVTIDAKGVMDIHKGCAVAGLGGDPNAQGRERSGTFDYYISEPVRSNDAKAVGPYILASLEIESLKK
jgi:unsaturated rhamnogalacturonyl hydrolase